MTRRVAKLATILLITSLLACFSWATPPGQPHLAYKPKGKTLKQRERTQARNLKHARYVASYGAGRNRVWHRRAKPWIRRELAQTRDLLLLRSLASPHAAICFVFGPYCGQALSVVSCETGGTFWVGASNGQYVNIFQMGYNERRTYGWHVAGSPAIVAARAAWNYFVASGKDWSPWTCKP